MGRSRHLLLRTATADPDGEGMDGADIGKLGPGRVRQPMLAILMRPRTLEAGFTLIEITGGAVHHRRPYFASAACLSFGIPGVTIASPDGPKRRRFGRTGRASPWTRQSMQGREFGLELMTGRLPLCRIRCTLPWSAGVDVLGADTLTSSGSECCRTNCRVRAVRGRPSVFCSNDDPAEHWRSRCR